MPRTGTTSRSTPDPRRWKALSLLALADFVVILDATIVNIALPSVGRALHASNSSLSWVVSAYILAFCGLLLGLMELADARAAGVDYRGDPALLGRFAASVS